MSSGTPPPSKNSLFPDSWVVGAAAADLARDDKNVAVDANRNQVQYADGSEESTNPADAASSPEDEALGAELGDLGPLQRDVLRVRKRLQDTRERVKTLEIQVSDMHAELEALREERAMLTDDRPAHLVKRGSPRGDANDNQIRWVIGVLLLLVLIFGLYRISSEIRNEGTLFGQPASELQEGLANRFGALGDSVRGLFEGTPEQTPQTPAVTADSIEQGPKPPAE